jgi:sigma-E factor negative regulatory protein RseC
LRPKAGDRVLIGIDEGYLQKTTLLLYLVPLLGLLLGAIFGAYLGGLPGSLFGSELMSILFCLLGLSVGLWVTSRTTANDSGRSAQAVRLLRIEPASLAVGIVGSTPSSPAKKTSDTNQAN